MSTTVINLKNAPKGWRENPAFVYVGRSRSGKVTPGVGSVGYFGNPFPIGNGIDRDEAVRLFREQAENRIVDDPDYRDAVRGLAGKTLVCYCAPLACHGDVLAELADRLTTARIVVTEEDIRAGRPCDHLNCPIARAGKRVLPFEPYVGGINLYKVTGASDIDGDFPIEHVSELPAEAHAFAKEFDNGRPVVPFVFELRLQR